MKAVVFVDEWPGWAVAVGAARICFADVGCKDDGQDRTGDQLVGSLTDAIARRLTISGRVNPHVASVGDGLVCEDLGWVVP